MIDQESTTSNSPKGTSSSFQTTVTKLGRTAAALEVMMHAL
jgi:hypothetical protein